MHIYYYFMCYFSCELFFYSSFYQFVDEKLSKKILAQARRQGEDLEREHGGLQNE